LAKRHIIESYVIGLVVFTLASASLIIPAYSFVGTDLSFKLEVTTPQPITIIPDQPFLLEFTFTPVIGDANEIVCVGPNVGPWVEPPPQQIILTWEADANSLILEPLPGYFMN